MQEPKDRWYELCKEASVEKDPERLLKLIQEINQLLEDKEAKLRKELWL